MLTGPFLSRSARPMLERDLSIGLSVYLAVRPSISICPSRDHTFSPSGNNNNNNSKTMFMVLSPWQSHCESLPGSFDECRTAPNGRRPKTKPDDLGCESTCTGCQSLYPPSPFIIIITHPERWYWFYRPSEDRRLSRPSWLVTYRDGSTA